MTKKEIIKYLKEKELNIQSAIASIFILDLAYTSYVNSQIVHGKNFSPSFCYVSYKPTSIFYQFIPQKNINEVARKIYFDFLKNRKTMISKMKRHRDLERQADKIWGGYQKNKDKIPKKDLLKIYRELVKVSYEWLHYAAIGEDKGGIIGSEIVPKFAERNNLSLAKANEVINILSHPEKPSALFVERKYFLDVCVSFLKKKNLEKKIDAYIKNYFWFKTNFYKGKKITPESLLKDILKEIKTNKKVKILKESRDFNKNFNKINRQKKRLLSLLKLTNEDKKDIEFARLTIQWIDMRKVAMMKIFYYLFTFLGDLAEKEGYKYHDLTIYTVDEIDELLAKNKKISKKDTDNRNKGVFLVFEKNKKEKMFYGREGKKMFGIGTRVEKQKEIKGQVASTGGVKEIKGRTRIVLNPKKDKFNEGEILVTSMTRVDYVPMIRIAKAIITNEGGMACHAAIVSRELNIPCIVGTKTATDVLKNGDYVQLDLNAGIIKKID
ncbi:hypothetical protein KJA13_03935 [Patescibacteria group bacterium]|nr:hypothetical protein [Patescibacteria group bacterium]